MRRAIYSGFTDPAAGSTTPILSEQEITDLNNTINSILDDNILDASEKVSYFIPRMTELTQLASFLIAKANSLSIDSTNLVSAKNSIDNYLATIVPAWNDQSQNSPIDRNIFNGLLEDYTNYIAELQTSIQGLEGPAGPTVTIDRDKTSFDFINGTLAPNPQTINFIGKLDGDPSPGDWTTIPNIKSESASSTFSISSAELGNYSSVTVKYTTQNVTQEAIVPKLADAKSTEGAPNGTPVGDRNAEDVTGGLDNNTAQLVIHTTHLQDLDADITQAQTDITDLFTTYGDTASAAQSAADAAASLTTVQGIEDHIDAQKLLVDQAKAAAEAAEQGATDQAGFAEADRIAAQTARGGAESARDTAIIARDTAQGHAATATTQAALSVSSSDSAKLAALATYSTRTDTLDDWQHTTSADPRSPLGGLPPQYGAQVVNDSDLGPTIEQTLISINVRTPMPCVAGRKYRVRGAERLSAESQLRLYVQSRTADNQVLTATSVLGPIVAANEVSSVDTVLDCDSFLTANPSTAYLVISFTSEPNVGGRLGQVFIEDVTESEKAESAASAALVSSSTATTKANEATTQAGIATTQAGIATAKAGDATTQAGFAQQYKADAEAAADNSESSSLASAASALTASSGSDSARLAALATYSTRTDRLDDWQAHSADPRYPLAQVPPVQGAQVVNDPDLGPVISQTALRLVPRATLRCVAGRKYRVRASSKHEFTDQPDNRIRLLVYKRDAVNTALPGSDSHYGSPTYTDEEISVLDAIIDCDSLLAAAPTTAYVYLYFIDSRSAACKFGRVFIEDVTESELAEASSSAAVVAAATATTKRDEASGFAATATTQAGLAVDAKNDAQTAAGVSTAQAAIATDKAAAAQLAFELAASIGQGFLNPNSGFDDYPSATVGQLPAGWLKYVGTENMYRVADPQGGYAMRLPGPAGVNSGVKTAMSPTGSVRPGEWFVIEGEAILNSGTLQGTAVHAQIYNSAGTTALADDALSVYPFVEHGNGVVGKTYRVEKLVRVDPAWATADRYMLYAMSHWSYGDGGSISAANDLTWLKCGIRRATEAEIAAGTTLPDLEASVATNIGAIAGIEGSAAFLEQIVAASGGNPAKFQMLAGKDGSRIGLVADVISLGNDIDGIIEDVLVVENGQAKINDAIIRRLRVAPTEASEILHEVALKPLTLLAGDGDAVQYQGGASYGVAPDRVEVDIAGAALPALAAGEAYDIKPTNITATGFTMRAKKLTAGGAVTQNSNAGTNVGGDPQWQTNKPTAANAQDGNYQFFGIATLTQISGPDLVPEIGKYYSTYQGQVVLKGKVGSSWTTLATRTVTRSYSTTEAQGSSSHTATKSFGFSEVVNSSADFGSGAGRFGLHPGASTSITAFAKVSYSTQTTSNETSVGGLFKVTVYPPSGD